MIPPSTVFLTRGARRKAMNNPPRGSNALAMVCAKSSQLIPGSNIGSSGEGFQGCRHRFLQPRKRNTDPHQR